MTEGRESDGVVTQSILKSVVARLKSHDHAARWLGQLGRREPHLAGMLEAGLLVAVKRMRALGAPHDAVDAGSRQLRLLGARLLSALRLADVRYQRGARRKEA
jgi:hypothetical protein